jgi:CheY-like chemotaxis protein
MDAKRILIVDDQMDWRLLVRMSLDSYNIEIIEADDGQKGINLAESARPDLIIIDNNMPVLSGYEAIKKIRANPSIRSMPIIMLTSKGFDSQMKEMIMLDISEFISKPFEEDKLIESIEKIIGKLPPKNGPAIQEEATLSKKIIMFVENNYAKKQIFEEVGIGSKVVEVTTKKEFIDQVKQLIPDIIICSPKLLDWNDYIMMEVFSFALNNNILILLDLSHAPNEGIKRILESKNTSLFEFKSVRLQEVIIDL